MHGIKLDSLISDVVRLSQLRGEPDWLREWRLNAIRSGDFERHPFEAGTLLNKLDTLLLDAQRHLTLTDSHASSRAQSDSESVFETIRARLAERGVVIEELSKAARDHRELIEPHLGTIVPNASHDFATVNSALWTEGWFVYVPRGVQVEQPLQIPSRAPRGEGPCERTLIVCEEEGRLDFIDGCMAPIYTNWPVLSSVVEVALKRGACCRLTSIQNGTHNMSRFDAMSARAQADACIEWNVLRVGGKSSEVLPCTYLLGRGARTEIWTASYAMETEHRTIGGQAIHCAPQTGSRIINKIVRQGGAGSWDRSLVEILKGCRRASTHVESEALLLHDDASADLSPRIEADEPSAEVHQSTRSMKMDAQDLLYLQSRGLSREQALAMRVLGFLEPFTNRLPKEYAVEVHRWIELAMEGSVG